MKKPPKPPTRQRGPKFTLEKPDAQTWATILEGAAADRRSVGAFLLHHGLAAARRLLKK